MTNVLRVDAESRKLIMDKTFAKNAEIVGSAEYNMLQRARNDYEGYTVITRQIKRNPNKESYRGLTYQYMADYIMTHEDLKTANAVLEKFEEMRLISQCHSKAFRYPTIKKWFLTRYPEVRNFGVQAAEYTAVPTKSSEKSKEVA